MPTSTAGLVVPPALLMLGLLVTAAPTHASEQNTVFIRAMGITTQQYAGGAGIQVDFSLAASFDQHGRFVDGVALLIIHDMEWQPLVTGGRLDPVRRTVNLTVLEVIDPTPALEGVVFAAQPDMLYIEPAPPFRFHFAQVEVRIAG